MTFDEWWTQEPIGPHDNWPMPDQPVARDAARYAWDTCQRDIDRLTAENKALQEALCNLVDEQNGPPLIRHEKNWQAAYDRACELVGYNTVKGPES